MLHEYASFPYHVQAHYGSRAVCVFYTSGTETLLTVRVFVHRAHRSSVTKYTTGTLEVLLHWWHTGDAHVAAVPHANAGMN